MPGQAGTRVGCFLGVLGVSSAQAGPRLPAWLSQHLVVTLGLGKGWRPEETDTSEELHGGRADQDPRGLAS